MTLAIPKDLRSISFTELSLVELNDTDVDRILTHLIELMVKQGRTAASRTDAADYELYLDRLVAHPRIGGFEGAGRQVLDGWLQASVVKMGRAGQRRASAQMDYVLPLTIATYRSGLPKARTRNRQADALVYHELVGAVERRGSNAAPRTLAERTKEVLGHGVTIGPSPDWKPAYDGTTHLDVTTLLCLCFLEGFEPSANPRTVDRKESPVPGATEAIGDDLLDYLVAYGGDLPAADLGQHLAALSSLRLFQLPLRMALVVRSLLRGRGWPSADKPGSNPLELYCDFTGVRGSDSDDLARLCVQRDLDVLRGFFPDRLKLRSIREAIEVLGQEGRAIKDLPAPDRFAALAEQAEHPMISSFATMQLGRIETETRASPASTDEDLEYLDSIRSSAATPMDQLTTVLTEGLRKRGFENQVKWFWSTGGIAKPYGLLDGTLRSRRSWRYAPSDELLFCLLLTVFIEAGGERVRPHMPIAELLQRLTERFGVLVDRPPAGLDSTETRAAAAENLEAFKRRLQLLGCFDSLADDFSAQQVRHPRG